MQKPLGSHGTGVSVSQVHPSQAMADVLWILLLDSVNKKDRPQYEGGWLIWPPASGAIWHTRSPLQASKLALYKP